MVLMRVIESEVTKTKYVCKECMTPCELYVDDEVDPDVKITDCPWEQTNILVTPRWAKVGIVVIVAIKQTNVELEVSK
jgi:hypothetical protein